jgi:HD superfamily phosphohydrolase
MMLGRRSMFRDSLYGVVRLDDELAALAAEPIVQRLRHVRLSNIDSIDLPGIASLSRYEHVLGVAYLASQVGFRSKLSRSDDLILTASALLHDWAITSFGHLVEEALQYVGTGFDHQERLRQIALGKATEEVLGVERQILLGRGTGLSQWLRSVAQSDISNDQLLAAIMSHIHGGGRRGRVICGDIDLDNIDNVFRMAYHLGLEVDRATPIRLAGAIVDCDRDGAPIFLRKAEKDIQTWRSTRSAVYENLMLAPHDFVGKTMMLYATIRAFEDGEIKILDWSMTDFEYLHRLLSSDVSEAKDAAVRWIAGELWDFVPLQWMGGERPDYTKMRSFSIELSKRLGRTCFAYGIKDKRDRRLTVIFDDGSRQTFGSNPQQWVLGVGSPERRVFTAGQSETAFELAQTYFGTRIIGPASREQSHDREVQPSLL